MIFWECLLNRATPAPRLGEHWTELNELSRIEPITQPKPACGWILNIRLSLDDQLHFGGEWIGQRISL